MVDATHPFAATISANAVAAAVHTGTPLLRLQRPGWRDHPDADRWTWVATVDEAVAAGARSRRPFLTTGRQSLDRFLPWADRDVTVRVVDLPEFGLPERWRLIRSRGPYAYAGELTLMRDAGSDLLVTKDSGGTSHRGQAGRGADLGMRVVVIERPTPPPGCPIRPPGWTKHWPGSETISAPLTQGGRPEVGVGRPRRRADKSWSPRARSPRAEP